MNKEEKKHTYKDSLRELVPYVFLIFTVVLIRTFIITPIKVNGTSMTNTLDNGDTMILNKISMKIHDIKRFQIVVIKENDTYLIKRVIGLPGEHIKYVIDEETGEGILYINNKKVKETFISDKAKSLTCNTDSDLCKDGIRIPNNYYFVMGDNRGNSIDSRMIGLINIKDIAGTTKFIVFPFNKFGIVK